MAFALSSITACEFPLFAFSHCRDVVVAVSRAGGFGVLGAVGFSPEQLEQELQWIDAHIDGKPYGVDVLIPDNQVAVDPADLAALAGMIPQEHRRFVGELLHGAGIAFDDAAVGASASINTMLGEELMAVAFRHPIRLIANALGVAPPRMIALGREHGVPVAALVGAKEHAIKQVQAGVDIIVAQGTEAGGHCGEVSTLVLVPEVIAAIRDIRPVPVLAAGGIMTGRQMAGMMAMGAAGAWCGSVWLATTEAETSETFRAKMVAASSRDTVRSMLRTGKPSRQLRTVWHDSWKASGPAALPMPLMSMVSEPAFAAIDKAAQNGNAAAQDLASYFVGQGVGLVTQVQSATSVVQSFKADFAEALGDVLALIE